MGIDATSLINPKIAITLWIIGAIIKHVEWKPIKDFSNRFIPAVLMIVGILMSTITCGDVTFDSVLIGAVTAMFAVGVHSSGKSIFGEILQTDTVDAGNISITSTNNIFDRKAEADENDINVVSADENEGIETTEDNNSVG